MRYRVRVEAEWMLHLIRHKVIPEEPGCSFEQIEGELTALWKNFNDASASRIKAIEATTNHDLKSVEYFMKENLTGYK